MSPIELIESQKEQQLNSAQLSQAQQQQRMNAANRARHLELRNKHNPKPAGQLKRPLGRQELHQRRRNFQRQQHEQRRRSQRLRERINYNLEFKFREQERKRLDKSSSFMLSKIKQVAALSVAAAAGQQQQAAGEQLSAHGGGSSNIGQQPKSASLSPAAPQLHLRPASSASSAGTQRTTSELEDKNNNSIASSNFGRHKSAPGLLSIELDEERQHVDEDVELDGAEHKKQLNDDNNNNHQSVDEQTGVRSQDELIDIVEVSRKRRLSKDSADSLDSFIRWSFEHLTRQRAKAARQAAEPLAHLHKQHKRARLEREFEQREATPPALKDMPDEDQWAAANLLSCAQRQRHLLRQQQQQLGGARAESSAGNLALLRDELSGEPIAKRACAPAEATSARKTYLGSVVDRLHVQQRHQQQQQQQLNHDSQDQLQLEQSNSGLSFHLQRFLSQQSSLEDLCSSMGLDDSNQLVLAAAIHRALVDSVKPERADEELQVGESKSMAPKSLGGPSTAAPTLNKSGANLHLIDSLTRARQASSAGGARSYNTRAALHGLAMAASAARQEQQQEQHQRRVQGAAAALSAMTGLSQQQQQQQRHAQAAAALSALASAGSAPNATNSFVSGGGGGGGGLYSAGSQLVPASTGPLTDFECDTCGSSFDDRHRLMQHQSIHLDLRKSWFTETPVDEVMKIFNRRRGEFLCSACDIRFEATFDYDKHNHQVHGQRPYCCQFCGNGTRTFRFWRQYLNHLYDHRYIFSCTIDDCDFTVNRRDSLRFHIFRFHLNCQLPEKQASAHQMNHRDLLLSVSDIHSASNKWPHQMLVGPDDEDNLIEMTND